MREAMLVASSGETYNSSIATSRALSTTGPTAPEALNDEVLNETNYFKSIQWSPDGTTLLTNSADNIIRSFILPTDLLSPQPAPHDLKPYTTTTSPEPIYSLTTYPRYDLNDPSTTLFLSCPRDHPTRLQNTLDPASKIIATYPLVNATTEAFETPHSLLFFPLGTHFLTGTTSQISLFDISRSGHGPTTVLPTIPSRRHKMKGGGVGMRGIVSALALQPDGGEGGYGNGMLAAGTWTRWVSLYDAQGLGGTVSNWCVASASDSEAGIGGKGVSQVSWSACGRYLLVTERKSSGILIYDVRVTGKLVGWLERRCALSNQRIGIDVFGAEGGSEVWCGGIDGVVRVWDGVGMREGGVEPDREWNAHGDTVGGVAIHPSGCVVATCSGQRRDLGADIGIDIESENESESESESVVSDDTDDDSSSEHPSQSSVATSSHGNSITSRPLFMEDNSIKVWSL